MTTLEYTLCLLLILAIGIALKYYILYKSSNDIIDRCEATRAFSLEQIDLLKKRCDDLNRDLENTRDRLNNQISITIKAVVDADNFNIERDLLRHQLKTSLDKMAEMSEALNKAEVVIQTLQSSL